MRRTVERSPIGGPTTPGQRDSSRTSGVDHTPPVRSGPLPSIGCRPSPSPPATSRPGISPRPSRGCWRASRPVSGIQTLLGVTGSGKTFTMANLIAQTGRPALVIAHNKTLAAQLCNEFREYPARQRGRVLRQLLRLLPARGVPAGDRYLHREGLVDQRRDRPAAPCRHQRAARTARRGHRRVGQLHLRHRVTRLYRDRLLLLTRRRGTSARRHLPQAGRGAVPAQRHGAGARPVPRARRRVRGPARQHGDRVSGLDVRRRGGVDRPFRRPDRRGPRVGRPRGHLAGDPLRHAAGHRPAGVAWRSGTSSRCVPTNSIATASSSRPTAFVSAPSTTWR